MKIKTIRYICAILAMLLILVGCTSTQPVPEQSQTQQGEPLPEQPIDQEEGYTNINLRVAYDDDSTLNPYTTLSTQNYYVARLMYDSLMVVDENYTTHANLASSVAMSVGQAVVEQVDTADDTQGEEVEYISYTQTLCTIELRSDAYFWNGDPLTADDVIYSLYQAMASPYYAAGLTHIMRATADPENSQQLSIVLSRPDAFFEHSLTFPIVQEGTGAQATPMGSGRFQPSGETTLVANSAHFEPANNFERIELMEIVDIDSAAYSVKTGLIDIAFSDLRSTWNKSLGNGFTSVQLSNMVYLGVNKSSGLMANAELRSVLSRYLNRSELSGSAYSGQDSPVLLPFHPQLPTNQQVVQLDDSLTQVQAGILLDDMGYDTRDEQGYRMSGGGRMRLDILVNSENTSRVNMAQMIAMSCDELGIDATVTAVSFEDYEYLLSEGEYDVFIAEVKLPPNMNILPMLSGVGETSIGAWGSAELQSATQNFLETGEGFTEVSELFSEQMPFIPLLYRSGIVMYPLNFSSNILATEQDIFYNIQEWVVVG